ncbi:MAG: protein kinase [Deltaproteobacteria bacterium]|jgi:serine/threonine protein kinase|nr:protein kinase [Deltaproteobacteria bacterium]
MAIKQPPNPTSDPASALTAREDGPSSAATAESLKSARTVRDWPQSSAAEGDPAKRAQTVRDSPTLSGAITPLPSVFGLKTFRGYPVSRILSSEGGEADIYVIEDANGREYVLRLYRQGKEPKIEVFSKLKELAAPQYQGLFCATYETGFDDSAGRYYEIQEFLPLGDLEAYLREGRWKKEDFLATLTRIAEALNRLHAFGLIHRDIKPDNILLRSQTPLSLALADFGVSSLLAPGVSVKETRLANTPLYSAPESFADFAGIPGDWWSLGVVLLEATTRAHPLKGMAVNKVIREITSRGLPVPENLPARVSRLLRGLLTRDDKKRWGAREVERWLAGEEDIPVYYEEPPAEPASASPLAPWNIPYKFRGKDYFKTSALAEVFVENPENWKMGREHLARGYIRDWLEKRGEAELLSLVEKFQSLPPDEGLFAFIQNFKGQSPHIYRAFHLNRKNITALLESASLAGDAEILRDDLLAGKLAGLVGVAKNAGNRFERVLETLLSHQARVSPAVALNAFAVYDAPKNFVFGPSAVYQRPISALSFALDAGVPLIAWKDFRRMAPPGGVLPAELWESLGDPKTYSKGLTDLAHLTSSGLFLFDPRDIFPQIAKTRVQGDLVLTSPLPTEEALEILEEKKSQMEGGLDQNVSFSAADIGAKISDFFFSFRSPNAFQINFPPVAAFALSTVLIIAYVWLLETRPPGPLPASAAFLKALLALGGLACSVINGFFLKSEIFESYSSNLFFRRGSLVFSSLFFTVFWVYYPSVRYAIMVYLYLLYTVLKWQRFRVLRFGALRLPD